MRLPTGESVPVAVATDATVGDVKQALQDIKGVSPVHQKMSLSGKRLKDRAVLAEAGLSNGDEVDVRVGLNGGCSCCVNLCKALLILILFPFILLIMLFGILLWVLFLPFYLIAKVPSGQFLLIGVFAMIITPDLGSAVAKWAAVVLSAWRSTWLESVSACPAAPANGSARTWPMPALKACTLQLQTCATREGYEGGSSHSVSLSSRTPEPV